jgi:acyl-coenzyme A synthetase/AMP-(fatty) acid ligase
MFFEALPVTATGKVLRRQLVEQLQRLEKEPA